MFEQSRMSQLVGEHFMLMPLTQLSPAYQQTLAWADLDYIWGLDDKEFAEDVDYFCTENAHKLYGVAILPASKVRQFAEEDGMLPNGVKFDQAYVEQWTAPSPYTGPRIEGVCPVMLATRKGMALEEKMGLSRLITLLKAGETSIPVLFVPELQQIRRTFGDRYDESVLARCTEKRPSFIEDALTRSFSKQNYSELPREFQSKIAWMMAVRRNVWDLHGQTFDQFDQHSSDAHEKFAKLIPDFVRRYGNVKFGRSALNVEGVDAGRRTPEQMRHDQACRSSVPEDWPLLVLASGHEPTIVWVTRCNDNPSFTLRDELIYRQKSSYGSSLYWLTAALPRQKGRAA